jgi:hypothetical protein
MPQLNYIITEYYIMTEYGNLKFKPIHKYLKSCVEIKTRKYYKYITLGHQDQRSPSSYPVGAELWEVRKLATVMHCAENVVTLIQRVWNSPRVESSGFEKDWVQAGFPLQKFRVE